MPVFLEVRSGSQAGKRIRLEPASVLRVGRTPRADLVFADDSHMSGMHFSLGWEGLDCRISDLNSRNGVLVNGSAVKSAILRDGDNVVAGETWFLIRVEPDQPTMPSAAAALATPAPLITPQERLLPLLRRDLQPLYAILDAARDIRILALLVHHKAECQSLYEGEEGAKLSHVAPYLVKLPPDSPFIEPLVKEGWGKSWGVYLTCASDLPDVRRHLRHFLQVRLPDGEQVYFRFYDPRVMRIYLPTCVAPEADQFFGPIKRYLMEGETPEELWEFTTLGRGAEKRVLALGQAAPAGAKAASSDTQERPPSVEQRGGETQH